MAIEPVEFTVRKGYTDAYEIVNVPDGMMIYPSSNIIYNRMGKAVSMANVSTQNSYGGYRAMALDNNLVGFLGVQATPVVGNMIQGVGKSLWFVGSACSSGVKVYNTGSGVQTVIGDLSTTPQVAYRKDDDTGWDAPYQVGLSYDPDDLPTLELTDDNTRGTDFLGNITGSVSVRIARKRKGVVSIASKPSEVRTADADSVTLTIPAMPADGADTWLLYFTVMGRGSQYSHLLLPIELPETQLDGTDTPVLYNSGKNCRLKVIEQHASTQSNRRVEVEFFNNDLLAVEPFEDYYPADDCSFITQLGNVMLLIGTGSDGTGFDVSYPNNHESFPPDWRDWLAEVPTAVCSSPEVGIVWIATANTLWQAIWAGTTQETAPVVLRQVSDKYGCVAEQAMTNVNGYLFGVTKGNTPFMVAPNGEMDVKFGLEVRKFFEAMSDSTSSPILCGFDEDTNSVIFSNANAGIGFSIDNRCWTSPLTLTPDSSYDLIARFSINGKLGYCWNNGSTLKYGLYNYGDDLNWALVTAFKAPTSMELFDVIEFRGLFESSKSSETFTIKTYRNWTITSAYKTFTDTFTLASSGVKASIWRLVESLDYDSLSIGVSGTKAGSTTHSIITLIDTHTIRRGT